MKKLTGNTIRAFMRWRSKKVLEFAGNARNDQEQIFRNLIHSAQNTLIGNEYDFKNIANIADYSQAVPLMDYETLKPYFKRTLRGEQNVFWPDKISLFSKSSGTTSEKSKFIPVSQSTLKTAHYRGAFDVASQFCFNKPDTKVFHGKTIIISGSIKPASENPPVQIGDVSAILIQQQPILADFLRVPPKKTALIEDFEKKIALVVRQSVRENITGMAGVPTWNIVMLQRILRETGKSHIGEVWPGFELYIHGGVNFQPHRTLFEELVQSQNMEYVQTYNASEGFFAFQDRLRADDMLLATNHGIFYEFIPAENLNQKELKAIPLSEVKTGVNYAMVISTNSGLWRYQIGDTIMFTSLKPYRIKVTGRTKSFINAFGEELIVENADYAIEKASERTNAFVKYYTAGPKYFESEGKACHEWIIEFSRMPDDFNNFVRTLDWFLKEANSDYEAKRFKDLALTQPMVYTAQEGLFYRWLESKNKIGAQMKVPKLKNDRSVLDELFALQNKLL